MISKEQKDQMTRFIAERFEDAGLYRVLEQDVSHLLVTSRNGSPQTSRPTYIIAHNRQRTIDDIEAMRKRNREEGISTTDVFYKDGAAFMVRLGRRGNIKGTRALSRYRPDQVNAMIHLRGLEKYVLGNGNTQQTLVFYQPPTPQLEEGIRFFHMGDVVLDYSHLSEADPAAKFAQNHRSLDYRFPIELAYITGGPLYLLHDTTPARRAILSPQCDGKVNVPRPHAQPEKTAAQLSLF